MDYFAQQLINALQVASVYGLLAVSYVLIHAITRRINFGFGALALWGGYTGVNTTLYLMLEWPGAIFMPMLAAGLVAALHTMLTGAMIDRWVARPLLREASLATLIATLGLTIAMEEAMRIANDSHERWLYAIAWRPIRLGGSPGFPLVVTPIQLTAFAVALTLAGALIAFIKWHSFGRAWRACSQDLKMAELTGLDVDRVVTITFLIASGLAGMSGVLISFNYGVASFSGSLVIGLKTLFVAVVGGLSSVEGVFVSALILGLFETFWSGYVGPDYRDVAAFVALSGLMIVFPQGLFDGGSRQEPV